MGLVGNNRYLLQCAGGLWRAPVGAETALLIVLPIVIAISFLLIADIDAPRGGLIRIRPRNLASLAQSLPR